MAVVHCLVQPSSSPHCLWSSLLAALVAYHSVANGLQTHPMQSMDMNAKGEAHTVTAGATGTRTGEMLSQTEVAIDASAAFDTRSAISADPDESESRDDIGNAFGWLGGAAVICGNGTHKEHMRNGTCQQEGAHIVLVCDPGTCGKFCNDGVCRAAPEQLWLFGGCNDTAACAENLQECQREFETPCQDKCMANGFFGFDCSTTTSTTPIPHPLPEASFTKIENKTAASRYSYRNMGIVNCGNVQEDYDFGFRGLESECQKLCERISDCYCVSWRKSDGLCQPFKHCQSTTLCDDDDYNVWLAERSAQSSGEPEDAQNKTSLFPGCTEQDMSGDFNGLNGFTLMDVEWLAEAWSGHHEVACMNGDLNGINGFTLGDISFLAEVWSGKQVFLWDREPNLLAVNAQAVSASPTVWTFCLREESPAPTSNRTNGLDVKYVHVSLLPPHTNFMDVTIKFTAKFWHCTALLANPDYRATRDADTFAIGSFQKGLTSGDVAMCSFPAGADIMNLIDFSGTSVETSQAMNSGKPEIISEYDTACSE